MITVKLNGKEFKELNILAKELYKIYSIGGIKFKLGAEFNFKEGINYNNYSDNMRTYTKKELALILAERMLLKNIINC